MLRTLVHWTRKTSLQEYDHNRTRMATGSNVRSHTHTTIHSLPHRPKLISIRVDYFTSCGLQRDYETDSIQATYEHMVIQSTMTGTDGTITSNELPPYIYRSPRRHHTSSTEIHNGTSVERAQATYIQKEDQCPNIIPTHNTWENWLLS